MSHTSDQIERLHTLIDEARVRVHLLSLDEKDRVAALLMDADRIYRGARALPPAIILDTIERLESFLAAIGPLLVRD